MKIFGSPLKRLFFDNIIIKEVVVIPTQMIFTHIYMYATMHISLFRHCLDLIRISELIKDFREMCNVFGNFCNNFLYPKLKLIKIFRNNFFYSQEKSGLEHSLILNATNDTYLI